jgi:hypothetical protein
MGFTTRQTAATGVQSNGAALNGIQYDNNLILAAQGLGFNANNITTNTLLAIGTHDSRELICNSVTAITLTLPQAPSGNVGIRFYGVNIGSGAISYANATGVVINLDSQAPLTTPQWNGFELILVAANTYVRRV